MLLKNIRVAFFRNLRSGELNLSPGLNVFLGANAQGKTNLLEAASCLEAGRSFRGAKISDMIQHGESTAVVAASVQRDPDMTMDSGLKIQMTGSRGRQFVLNGKTVDDLRDYLGHLHFVIFSAEMIYIASGEPQVRRDFLDQAVFAADSHYILILREYRRILKNRNAVLQNSPDNSLLVGTWTEKLVQTGARIAHRRCRFIEAVQPLAADYHRSIAGDSESLNISYISQYARIGDTLEMIETRLRDLIKTHRHDELERGITLAGPHRDDLSIMVNEKSLRFFGSRGQKRTCLMAIKLAELNLFHTLHGVWPILILDDIAAELDAARHQAFLDAIPESVQILLSATEQEATVIRPDMRVFRVEQGEIKPYERYREICPDRMDR